eukprot:TRINITY_DN2618_c0_g1_i1.p1 TRINITY_DN2618_c0_g1~~TRINITY_DN2618_c0_g1_i1.p1  ORF type:complete len:569 (+),score=109.30 TRINITY_DN2618_c0_g1_i1:142-1848(+)
MFLPELLVCIDFEATCEKDDKNYYNEIIEFPAILIDTKKKTVISEFHRYVKPTVNPILSKFCVELTSVTQENIDKSACFDQVLSEFETWLRAHNAYDSSRTAIICDGVWDIQKFIFIEFGKLLEIKEETRLLFSRWMNCKDIFRAFYRGSKSAISGGPVTLSSMLENLGLRFNGRLHSGMDDTRNLSAIILEILKQGGQKYFKITNTIDFGSAYSEISGDQRRLPKKMALKKDSILNDTTSEIRAINRALEFDTQHNPLSMHNRFQLFQFKGTLNQLRATFGNLHVVDSSNGQVNILIEACGHRDRGGDFPTVRLRKVDVTNLSMYSVFGYNDGFEYELSQEQQKISFMPDCVEFHRCCLKGSFSDIRRAVNNSRLNQWNSLIQIQLALPKTAKVLRSEPFPSPRSLEICTQTYSRDLPSLGSSLDAIDSCWAELQQDDLQRLQSSDMDPKVFCKHIFKKSKKFRGSNEDTRLEPPKHPAVGFHVDIGLEAAWICWRKALLDRRNELHSLRRNRRKQVLTVSGRKWEPKRALHRETSSNDESENESEPSPISTSPASPPESRLFGIMR